MKKPTVVIVGTGIYLPQKYLTAKEISEQTNGVWSEQAVIEKLGIVKKTIPGDNDGTQEMGVFAALDALNSPRKIGQEEKNQSRQRIIGKS